VPLSVKDRMQLAGNHRSRGRRSFSRRPPQGRRRAAISRLPPPLPLLLLGKEEEHDAVGGVEGASGSYCKGGLPQ